MANPIALLRRLATRDERRRAAADARVVAVLAESTSELTAVLVGKFAGMSAAEAYDVLGRLVTAERVTSRWSEGHAKPRIVFRLVESTEVPNAQP